MLATSMLLMSCHAEAKDPEMYPPNDLQPFLGLDDTSVPTRLRPGRASSLQNVSMSLSADLRKRAGLKVIGNSLKVAAEPLCTVTGLTYVPFAGGTARIVAVCDGRMSYLNGASWSAIVPAPAAITIGANNQFVFTTALSNLIATNDTDAPLQWDGGSSSSVSGVTFNGLANTVQSARVTSFFQNYLVFGNTVEAGTRYPTRVRWSNAGKVDTWTSADYNDVDAPAGQNLNCMMPLFGDLYLGFTNSFYKMSLVGGSGTFAFARVSNEVGCAAKNSVQQVRLGNTVTGLLFLDSKKRVYFFNGTTPVEVSQLIHGTLDGLNGNRLQYAVSAEDGEHYFLCASGGASLTNNLCLDYNYLSQEWSKDVYTGLSGINAFAKVIDSNGISQTYAGTGDSFVYQMTGTTLKNDVGSAGGVLEAVNTFATLTASSLMVLYDNDASFTTSGLIGAPIELTGGTASGLVGVIVDNTTSGLVVARDFSTVPDATTSYQVGRINAYYTTRWDDFGEPARLKDAGELFLVADASLGSTLAVGYAEDFQSNTATPAASLTPSAGSLWGTAVWGTDVWGGGDILLARVKLEATGRWWRFTFTEDDRDQTFRLHGWQVLHWKRNNF